MTADRPSESQARYLIYLIALAVGSSIFCLLATADYIMDDAFITLRYSHNFGQIGQPIWNKADIGNPSMGYTTPLWMILNAIPAVFTTDRDALVTFSRLLSFAALVGIIIVTGRAVNKLKIGFGTKLALIAGIFGQAGFAFHVNSGMETILFSFFILVSVVMHCTRPTALWSVIFGLFAFLTRPEGALVVVVLIMDCLRMKMFRHTLMRIVIFSSVVLSLATLLLAYYGDPLPNSFYVKQETGFSDASIIQTAFFIVTIALPFLFLSAYSASGLNNRRSAVFLIVGLVLGAYYLTVSPLMNVLSRYQWPILVLLIYGSLPALESLFTVERYRNKYLLWILALTLIVINSGNLVGSSYFAATSGRAIKNLISIGKAFASERFDGRWMVYHDAGAVCYYSDWNCYDTIGLNNREIAKGILTEDQILKREHSMVVLQNIDLHTQGSERTLQAAMLKYDAYSYHFVDLLTTLREGDNREIAVAVFARNVDEVKSIVDAADVRPDMDAQLFYGIYALVRQLVKGNQ